MLKLHISPNVLFIHRCSSNEPPRYSRGYILTEITRRRAGCFLPESVSQSDCSLCVATRLPWTGVCWQIVCMLIGPRIPHRPTLSQHQQAINFFQMYRVCVNFWIRRDSKSIRQLHCLLQPLYHAWAQLGRNKKKRCAIDGCCSAFSNNWQFIWVQKWSWRCHWYHGVWCVVCWSCWVTWITNFASPVVLTISYIKLEKK